MPWFAVYMVRTRRQVERAAGFQHGRLLADRSLTFWTMTAWESEASMRGYMLSGSHRSAMPHLMDWCDEASVAHWSQEEDGLPTWEEADQRMREMGRVSKVRHPSAEHGGLGYKAPRTTGGAVIRPVRQAVGG
jgi:hypothetical protein